MNVSEQFAQEYLRQHSLRPERFSKTEMRRSKTPDFKVLKEAEIVLFCEAKHIRSDEWLDKQLESARPGELVGGLRDSDPIFNRLSNHIHEAAHQFNAVNPNHAYPNVLVFANSDTQCGFPDLRGVITGNFYSKSGSVVAIYRQFSDGRIRKEKFIVDVYIWWDDWKSPSKFTRLLVTDSRHSEAVRMLLPR